MELGKKLSGKENSQAATSHNNLGLIYQAQGDLEKRKYGFNPRCLDKYENALIHQIEALKIVKELYSKTHPHVIFLCKNIAHNLNIVRKNLGFDLYMKAFGLIL